MKLITCKQRQQLLANAARRITDPSFDPFPVVKLYTIFVRWTWLLTYLDPNDPDLAYGLCDLGAGCPEIGWVSLAELAAMRMGPCPIVERDKLFKAVAPLGVYAEAAYAAGEIVA